LLLVATLAPLLGNNAVSCKGRLKAIVVAAQTMDAPSAPTTYTGLPRLHLLAAPLSRKAFSTSKCRSDESGLDNIR